MLHYYNFIITNPQTGKDKQSSTTTKFTSHQRCYPFRDDSILSVIKLKILKNEWTRVRIYDIGSWRMHLLIENWQKDLTWPFWSVPNSFWGFRSSVCSFSMSSILIFKNINFLPGIESQLILRVGLLEAFMHSLRHGLT